VQGEAPDIDSSKDNRLGVHCVGRLQWFTRKLGGGHIASVWQQIKILIQLNVRAETEIEVDPREKSGAYLVGLTLVLKCWVCFERAVSELPQGHAAWANLAPIASI
jgi:hypothetical protein